MSSTTIEWCRILRDEWVAVTAIRIGDSSRAGSSPDFYITVNCATGGRLRIDAYVGHDAPNCFREAILWGRWIAVGLGAKVHLVDLGNRDLVSIDLIAYFSSFHATRDFLLIASAEQIFRLDPNGKMRRKSRRLGIDGMIIRKVESGCVFIDAEVDPPGGWLPYVLDAFSGEVV